MVGWPGRAIFLLALLLACAGLAEARVYQQVGASRGLEARVISDLLIDQHGYLWVASREGLFRFDGYLAQSWKADPDASNSISDSDIRSLLETRDGAIWIGTNGGGLNRYEPAGGRFSHFQHDPSRPDSLPDHGVYGMAEDAEGGLWVGTQRGLARMMPGEDRFEVFVHNPDDNASLSHNWVFSLHVGPTGTLWAATIGGGVNRWNAVEQSFTRYDLSAMTAGAERVNDVFFVHEFDNGEVWLGTRGGVVVLHPEGRVAEHLAVGGDGVNPLVTDGAVDMLGRLWLTGFEGPVIIDPQTRQWQLARRGELGTEGNLPSLPQVSTVIGHNLVFIGTWGGGVFRAALTDLPFSLVGGDTNQGGLSIRNTTAVMASDQAGRPFVGTFGGGPYRVDVETRAAQSLADPQERLATSGILSLAATRQDRLLAGGTSGLYNFDPLGGETRFESHNPDVAGALGEGYVNDLLTEPNGGLWLAVGGAGLYYRAPGGQAFDRYVHDPANPDSISGNYITALLDDPPARLWVGTRSSGLNRCRKTPWSCERFGPEAKPGPSLGQHRVTALQRDRRGRVWVATDGGGIARVVEDESGQVQGFERFDESHGLLRNGVMAIEEDLDESFWLSTRHGVSRFHPGSGRVANFVAASGLPVSHFNTNASAADDRYIYFGSVEGLLSIEKGSLLIEREPAPVRITRIQTAVRKEQPSRVWPVDGRLAVPYGNIVTLEYAALDFSEAAHEYGYRLHPEAAWTDVGRQHRVIVHGLPPGEYAFQARGRDVFGRWGESDTLELNIVAPFWYTAWFWLGVALLLAAIGFQLHSVKLRRKSRHAFEIRRLAKAREQALEQALGGKTELSMLTPRQKEVLQLIAEGHSTREIADILEVSIKTVEAHRANLMERVNIHDVPGLVRLAVRARLVSPQE